MRSRRRCAPPAMSPACSTSCRRASPRHTTIATEAALLREAAQLRLEHKHDAPGALADLARVPLSPRDQLIENQLQSLAKATMTTTLGIAYLEAIEALKDDAVKRAAAPAYADLASERLGDRQAAASAYGQVAEVEPGNRRAVSAFAVLGSKLAKWPEVTTRSFISATCAKRSTTSCCRRSRRHRRAEHARRAHAGRRSGTRQAQAAAAVDALFRQRMAVIHRDNRNDKAAAIARCARRSSSAANGSGSPISSRWRRTGHHGAAARCAAPSGGCDGRDLDALVAPMWRRSSASASRRCRSCRRCSVVRPQHGAAPRRFARRAPSIKLVKWAIDGLVELYRTGGRARCRRYVGRGGAVAVRPDHAPRDAHARGTARHVRARRQRGRDRHVSQRARIAVERHGSDRAPRAPARVEDRVPELLTLRQIQLGLETDVEEEASSFASSSPSSSASSKSAAAGSMRCARTSKIARATSRRSMRSRRCCRARHSIASSRICSRRRRSAWSRRVIARAPRSCGARFAHVAEVDCEIERAIGGHRRVVAYRRRLRFAARAARLNLERGQRQAVPWLESLLDGAGDERLIVVHQLAKAHLAAHQPDRAITAIETNLDEKTPAMELRLMLADLYRKADLWEPLARHLDAHAAAVERERSTRSRVRARSRPALRVEARLARRGDPCARKRPSSIRPTRICAPHSRPASAPPVTCRLHASCSAA